MPSIRNINTPKSVSRRALSHKRRAQRSAGSRTTVVRAAAAGARVSAVKAAGSGVVRKRPATSKAERKRERNRQYALERMKAMTAEEVLKKTGEVEMVDAATVPLSKRQLKLKAQREKVAEENAKTLAARKEAEAERAKKEAEKKASEWEDMEEDAAPAGEMEVDEEL